MDTFWATRALKRALEIVNNLDIDEETKEKLAAEINDALIEVQQERYNGWANRETWALYMWLSSDEGLYEDIRERANAKSVAEAVKGVKDYVEALFHDFQNDPATYRGMANMVMDVGSLWRVDWVEITSAFRD